MEATPGAFTQLFQAPAAASKPAPPAPPAPPSPPMVDPAPGAFTQLFQTPAAASKPAPSGSARAPRRVYADVSVSGGRFEARAACSAQWSRGLSTVGRRVYANVSIARRASRFAQRFVTSSSSGRVHASFRGPGRRGTDAAKLRRAAATRAARSGEFGRRRGRGGRVHASFRPSRCSRGAAQRSSQFDSAFRWRDPGLRNAAARSAAPGPGSGADRENSPAHSQFRRLCRRSGSRRRTDTSKPGGQQRPSALPEPPSRLPLILGLVAIGVFVVALILFLVFRSRS